MNSKPLFLPLIKLVFLKFCFIKALSYKGKILFLLYVFLQNVL
jgi:hypothetical protein